MVLWTYDVVKNDDTLGEDEDDGDVELWLEHTTLQGEAGRELRSRLSLNEVRHFVSLLSAIVMVTLVSMQADSRIFSF